MEGEYPQNNKVGKRGLFPTLESNFIGEGLVAACWMVVKFTLGAVASAGPQFLGKQEITLWVVGELKKWGRCTEGVGLML